MRIVASTHTSWFTDRHSRNHGVFFAAYGWIDVCWGYNEEGWGFAVHPPVFLRWVDAGFPVTCASCSLTLPLHDEHCKHVAFDALWVRNKAFKMAEAVKMGLV